MDKVEYYGTLKQTIELEGDGYFFYGYGLPKEYESDERLVSLYNKSERSIEEFKKYVEGEIKKAGGNPEEWSA